MSLSAAANLEQQQQPNILPEQIVDGIDDDNNVSCKSSSSSSSESECTNTEKTDKDSESVDESIYTLKMVNLCKDIFLFALVIIVTYAALTNEPPKISKSPAAYPFFSKDSPIIDWYRGHLSNAIEHARSSDIAFVMFYAPWDAESQSARKQFELAAKYMQKFVNFAAVNCWHPAGECRNKYNKVYGWPVLIVYPAHGRGIQYNGPIIAEYIVKFLLNVCWPLKRLPRDQLLDYQDAYVTVNVNTLPGSHDYAVVYSTALKYLEKDPFQSVTFYVVPQPANFTPSLMLHLWNETLIYPVHELEWRPDVLLQWIFKNVHQVTKWLAPSGSKSLLLASSFNPGPSLILFTPANPLQSAVDYYDMLQEIGQEYYDCESNNVDLSQATLKRLGHLLDYQNLKHTCLRGGRNKLRSPEGISLVTTTRANFWANNSNCPNRHKNHNFCGDNQNQLTRFCASANEDFLSYDFDDEGIPYTSSLSAAYETSMWRGAKDPKSLENLLQVFSKEKCRLFLRAEDFQSAIFEKKRLNARADVNVTGLACKHNQSLSLVAMDSLNYYHFAERLGVDLFKNADKSAVVIINHQMETHYIMRQPINGQSIRDFIRNFTKNNLQRSLKSLQSIDSQKTHTYPLVGRHSDAKQTNQIVLEELNSQTFLPTILQSNKAVIVFYYSKQCSFCNGISHTFLSAAKQLSAVKNIRFARIDGELHVLPWEFSMESFPTILFFPSIRKSDSVAFPTMLPITVPNLIGFILTNLDPYIKLHAMWSICNETKFKEDVALCNQTLREEILTVIENTLKNWRMANKRQKQIWLHKLKQLKQLQLHLLVGQSPHKNNRLIDNYFVKLNAEPNFSDDYYYDSFVGKQKI